LKSRVQRIEIQNFKAFRKFSLNLEGRHLLLYGPNGSGKSSLYWALYTFLQSAEKDTPDVAKYFDPAGNQKLLNLHEDPAILPGKIALTIRDSLTKNDTTYPISKDDHGTHNQPPILKGNLASDFVTYRFFFGFSNFKNSERFDLWSLFETEILPFCKSRGGTSTPLQQWKQVKSEVANPGGIRGPGGADAYTSFKAATERFATTLKTLVEEIGAEAQKFYNTHFSEGDPTPVKLAFGVTRPPSFLGTDLPSSVFRKPIVELHIEIAGNVIKRPQSFLNEAKLTQLALSVRFAASLVNLHNSDIKLLVLDDLLVSLDMSNRMKFVEILLGKTFASYQKIILTHDRGFFEEFRRMIGTTHTDWCFQTLQGNSKDGVEPKEEKDPLEKATDYLNGHDLEAAALQLRKAAEDTAQSYLKMATGKAPKPGEFHSLSLKLDKAKNILQSQLPLQLFKDVCSKVPKVHRDKLVRMNDDDIDGDTGLTPDEKALLKQQREKLKQFMTKDAWKALEAIDVLDAVIQMKDRVLNPAAHWSETPLYDAEVKKALTLIARLEATLLK
jgi:energy-coupling factor transporter ATP-binding protein EcfA2